ncbi:MAG: adenosylcobinamide-GDP ribazoletransferase [Crenarchaeota archaeon]|nr:adenosylcobinamide-GDP ribazoletransferase [Thermoproteota archaeon]
MVKQLKNLLAFLTIIPVHTDMDCLTDSAKCMYLFPIIGAFLGLIAGSFGWVASQFLPSLVAGVLTFGVLLLLTGLHHTDGLLDFGDAIMFQGTKERKIEIMHDQLTGSGAIGLGIMTYLVTAIAIGQFHSNILIQSIIVIEVCAKLSMVLGTWAGKSVHKGMNSPFMESMHGKYGTLRLLAALIISFAITMPLMWFSGFLIAGFVVVIAALICSLVMVAIAHFHFGGVTGDVLGASNEITRMVCVIVLLVMIV